MVGIRNEADEQQLHQAWVPDVSSYGATIGVTRTAAGAKVVVLRPQSDRDRVQLLGQLSDRDFKWSADVQGFIAQRPLTFNQLKAILPNATRRTLPARDAKPPSPVADEGRGFPSHRQVSYTKVQSHRGKPRLWLEGQRLEGCGFAPGTKFRVELCLERRQVRLVIDPMGDRKVSVRQRTGDEVRRTPIVDVAHGRLSEILGEGSKVRAIFRVGEIQFDLHPTDLAKQERETRTKQHLAEGYLTEATLCAGGGVSTLALTEGLKSRGLKTRVDWIIDREGRYLDIAMNNNPAIDDATRLYEATLEEIDTAALSPVDILQVSLPCTGHSKSGKAKRNIKQAEDHPTDALAVYGLLRILEVVNPSVVVSENVNDARESASYALIRAYLVEKGYSLSEAILDGSDAGSIENRSRWWLCAVSEGLAKGFSVEGMPKHPRNYETLGEALEPVSESDARWRDHSYLVDKAIRDAAAGKNFKRQLVTPDSTSIGAIGRHYSKARQTEPLIVRADGLQRLLTPIEHARVKGIPEALVRGECSTVAHQVLGQSILFNHARSIGQALAAHFDVSTDDDDNQQPTPGM